MCNWVLKTNEPPKKTVFGAYDQVITTITRQRHYVVDLA